ncbi:TBC1 domain family member 30 isoform X1 [Halyomorpha halys]|uniref:TBC1 domain family member 30 isoform X1 n=1 Tax=Halyomorpha halys TaxID=286706 RepID=UPI0034D2B86D
MIIENDSVLLPEVELFEVPPWKRNYMVQKRRCKINAVPQGPLLPPIKIVLVQPLEKDCLKKTEKRQSLKKIEISPDFSTLVARNRDRPLVSSLPPPPLPEIPVVDQDAILREVLSSESSLNSCTSSASSIVSELTLPSLNDDDQSSLTEIPLSGGGYHQTTRDTKKEEKQRDEKERLFRLFDQLLSEINKAEEMSRLSRRRSDNLLYSGHYGTKIERYHSHCGFLEKYIVEDEPSRYTMEQLQKKSPAEMERIVHRLKLYLKEAGSNLVSGLEERDKLVTENQGLCDLITASLQAISAKRSSCTTRVPAQYSRHCTSPQYFPVVRVASLRRISYQTSVFKLIPWSTCCTMRRRKGEDTEVRFSVSPGGGDTGFSEWAKAMKMVARLPDGVPSHFRKTLWLSLAEKHLSSKNISWPQVERSIFSDRLNPDDQELSVQIVKDLHRTGCSLFCGTSGQHNQAVLKRVLLAYARWNKNVGYCQGLNMLAALILQVMQGCQAATVKVMIYLIEGVLPESYFADNLRGLSVDMAVFRDLLSLKLPELSRHLDNLQQESKDSGTSYEPPLMDVFTMQWFLTIFCNCLPQPTVLRLWDLLFLEGDSVLIKAALVIWQSLAERMLSVRSADEFYSIMAVLTREMMEFGLMEANNLIKNMDTLSVPELSELRDRYVYNISPWPVPAKKGLRIFYPHQHSGGLSEESSGEARMTPISNHPDREKIALDISALKKQYWKLRERQRQAHIILSAACRSESYNSQATPALNHLLLGKSALKSVKGRPKKEGETLHWKDTKKPATSTTPLAAATSLTPPSTEEDPEAKPRRDSSSSSSSSSSTELCDSSESEAEEAAKKRDDLMRILKENSEILGRFKNTDQEEPEDIKDIRRRYSVDPFPGRGASKPRELGVKLGLYSQDS